MLQQLKIYCNEQPFANVPFTGRPSYYQRPARIPADAWEAMRHYHQGRYGVWTWKTVMESCCDESVCL